MKRVIAVLAASMLVSTSAGWASPGPGTAPKMCDTGGGTVDAKGVVTHVAHDGKAFVTGEPFLSSSMKFTPRVIANLGYGVKLLVIDTSGALWQVTHMEDPCATLPWMQSQRLAATGYADVVAMVADPPSDPWKPVKVYAALKSGRLAKLSVNLYDSSVWKVTRAGAFTSKGWNTIRAMGRYYTEGTTPGTQRTCVLALNTSGQLLRYSIPAVGDAIGRTVLATRGWAGISHVTGHPGEGVGSTEGRMMAYTTGGEARVYYETNRADATGSDIRFSGFRKAGFVGVHF